MRLKIRHQTSYDYNVPVQYGLQQLRLRPKTSAGQSILDWELQIDGGRLQLDFEDQHCNHVDLVSVEPGQQQVHIVCVGEVETGNHSGVIGRHQGYAPLWLFERSTPLTRPGPAIRKLVAEVETGFDGDISRLHALSSQVLDTMKYQPDQTHSQTTAEEALASGHGVCQDHAQVLLAAARLLGYPARYVSGYLIYVEDIGWVGFDVSNGISPDERYVRIATGLDYRDAAPISGIRYGDSVESMMVSIQVEQ